MNSIFTKIIALSFLIITAACSEKVATEPKQNPKEEVSQEKKDEKAPLSQYKATTPRDKSTYKNPTF